MEIQPKTKRITLRRISILEDDINEAEEVFILVVKVVGVAQSMACFQQQKGGVCWNNTGGISIRICDNDRKLAPYSCLSLCWFNQSAVSILYAKLMINTKSIKF